MKPGSKHTAEAREKMCEAAKGKRLSPEHRRRIGDAGRGRKHTLESRQKMSKTQKGRKFSLEHRQKISEAQRGKKVSPETRQKMSDAKRGENNPNWKGGRRRNRRYLIVWNPDHPSANVSGYVFEHRLVMEEILGRPLRFGEVVHHINKNPADNRKENLMPFPSQKKHMKFHKLEI